MFENNFVRIPQNAERTPALICLALRVEVRVLVAELQDGRRVVMPRANVEMIET